MPRMHSSRAVTGAIQFLYQRLDLGVIALQGLPQPLNHSAIPTFPIFRHFCVAGVETRG